MSKPTPLNEKAHAALGKRLAELEEANDRRAYRLERAEAFFAGLAWPLYWFGIGLGLLCAVIAFLIRRFRT